MERAEQPVAASAPAPAAAAPDDLARDHAGDEAWAEAADARADTLYAADAAGLRAVHDAVVMLAHGLGEDAHPEVRTAADGADEPWVCVVRAHAFAVVGPGPGDTVRVGLRLPDGPPEDERLSPASGFGGATHWLDLPADCDEDDIRSVEPLLEAAYLQDG